MDSEERYHIPPWSEFKDSQRQALAELWRKEMLTDVTLCVSSEDKTGNYRMKAHKIVLSACSPYFAQLFASTTSDPSLSSTTAPAVIVLPSEVEMPELTALIEFIYTGEMSVSRDLLPAILRTATMLRIRGLSGEAGLQLPPPSTRNASSSSRDSSIDNNSRPDSQQSHGSSSSNKRKNSQPNRVSDNPLSSSSKRKCHKPNKIITDEDQPMDFTMKSSKDQQPPNCAAVNFGLQMSNYIAQTFGDNPYYAAAISAAMAAANGQPPITTPQTPAMVEQTLKIPSPPNSVASQQNSPSAKTTQESLMEAALEDLKSGLSGLSECASKHAVSPSVLLQRAQQAGLNVPPPKETGGSTLTTGGNKKWSQQDLDKALEELRCKNISANKAAQKYKIPSSTLYKIARKEGIELEKPFNAQQTAWTQDDLEKALDSIRCGSTVSAAAQDFDIPAGTLYGRCKKAGIDLVRSANVKWSEDAMVQAMEMVKSNGASINSASQACNVPYSSLYGRVKRNRKERPSEWPSITEFPEEQISNAQAEESNIPVVTIQLKPK